MDEQIIVSLLCCEYAILPATAYGIGSSAWPVLLVGRPCFEGRRQHVKHAVSGHHGTIADRDLY